MGPNRIDSANVSPIQRGGAQAAGVAAGQPVPFILSSHVRADRAFENNLICLSAVASIS